MSTGVSWGSRGRCPRCGSGRVMHLVAGLPTFDALTTAPEWVSFVGCGEGHALDRRCETCGHRWRMGR